MNILKLKAMKQQNQKISMVTCYDYWSARIIAQTPIDCILVGDSLAMVMHGHPTTIPATIDMMALHVAAVARGAPEKFIVGDMPFLSYRKGLQETMRTVEQLMQAGAKAIKLEGVTGHEEIIQYVVTSGIPVMGHIGLTPQSVHQLGGFKVQGNNEADAQALLEQAKILEQLGCCAVVLECVPCELAKVITQAINIPTIGIGAGVHVDGQVLVLHDLLGMDENFKPKFLKTYLKGYELFKTALNTYDHEVKTAQFPSKEHSFLGKT